ncbi:MAG: hypothetical protein ACREMB_06160 [Candidatus Rokuibacteriota bacterium]
MTEDPDRRLTLSPAEREQVAAIRSRKPAAATRVETHVRYVVERLIEVFHDLVADEAEVDTLLRDLADRLAGSVPADPGSAEAEALGGPETELLTRAVLADLRAEVVRRLLTRPGP